MIHKVRNEQDPFWDQFETDNIQRNSVSKSAFDSFTTQVALKVKTASANGVDSKTIASSMGLPTQMVEHLLAIELPEEQERRLRSEAVADRSKFASVEDKEEKSDYEQNLSAAEQAYNELHGNRRAKAALKDPIMGHAKSVAASRKGDLSEVSGPKKYMKYDSANSIWDSTILEKNLKKQDNGERIKAANEKLAEQRDERRAAQHTIDKDSLKEMLDNSEIRKDNGTYGYHAVEAHSYEKNVQKNGVSIFDLWDGKTEPKIATSDDQMFTRIASKTDGETSSEERNKEKKKDRSWVKQSAPKKMVSDIFQRMIDSVVEGNK